MRRRTIGLTAVVGVVITGVGAPAWATTYDISPGANLGAEIAKLQPGDELVLAGGTYTLTARLGVSVQGTAQSPIIIRSKDNETAHITRDASQNVINIENAAYLIFRGLTVSGGSHGIRIDKSSFITIEDCLIHSTADVGLSANISGSTYEGLIIRGNEIRNTSGTGEGMYLGCNNAACALTKSLIEGNWVHHTDGSGVTQGDGIELKTGSYENIIRDNVIHDTNYPCILAYGTDGKAQNLIERNAMWNCGDHGIQVAGDAIVRNNIILGAQADGLRNQTHQGATVQNLVIVHNTILNSGTALRSDSIVSNVLIANNALYSQNGNALQLSGAVAQATVAGNVGKGGLQGTAQGFDGSGDVASDFVDADHSGSKLNVYPKAGGKLIGAGDTTHVATDDYNGTLRAGVADVGAYKYDASGNPGGAVGPGFKSKVGSGGGPGTGGSTGSGGATASGGTAGSGGSTASGGASSGGASSGGSTASGGAASSSAGSDDGGCGCRTSPASQRGSHALLGLLVAAGLLRRRRGR
ncbi:MAG: right-handed parallel beta-helix repeat-containing protein [Polyangiaceae bacterium]|nr:right-handed parallel beta-helix repeat-containing protein [Polyangiaceae bacterium]